MNPSDFSVDQSLLTAAVHSGFPTHRTKLALLCLLLCESLPCARNTSSVILTLHGRINISLFQMNKLSLRVKNDLLRCQLGGATQTPGCQEILRPELPPDHTGPE